MADIDALVDAASAEQIKAQFAQAEPNIFIILPENQPVIRLWMRISHLWTSHGMGGIRSLDWPAVQSKIELIESRSDTRYSLEVIEGIEVMEVAALKILQEKSHG